MSRADTLAFVGLGTEAADQQVRHAICEALQERSESYSLAIQPEAESDERLRAAGKSPGCPLWCIRGGLVETDSSAHLSQISGARFVMVGFTSTSSRASLGSFLLSALTLFMVPPKGDQEEMELMLAIYDGDSGARVWTCHDEGFHKALSDPVALKHAVGEPVAKRLPFARR